MKFIQTNYTVPSLARLTPSPIAQRTLLEKRPEALVQLAGNPNLDRQVWYLLARKPKADVAYELVRRQLDLEQLRAVITDKRVTVRRTLVSSGLRGCTDEMGELLLSQPWFDAEYAGIWLNSETVPESLRKQVALIDNANGLLKLLADRDMFSSEEVLALLPDIELGRGYVRLHQLFDFRPELVNLVTLDELTKPRIAEAAAGSRHLFDAERFAALVEISDRAGGNNWAGIEILLSLLTNPNFPLEMVAPVVEKLSHTRWMSYGSRLRPVNVTIVVNHARARIAQTRQAVREPWENVIVTDRERVDNAVSLLGYHRYPSLRPLLNPNQGSAPVATSGNVAPVKVEDLADMNLRPAETNSIRKITSSTANKVCELLDPYGPGAWETFWSLIDTWQGDLGSLVDASISLNA